MRPFDSMIKECEEEASMPEEFVRKYIRCVTTTASSG
jgi:hypothetical protein